MQVELELDSGRRLIQEWPPEKVAFYLLASDTPHPKFENALRDEWVTYYISRARWDKASLTKDEYERIVTQWPKHRPRDPDLARLESIQVSWDRIEGGSAGAGISRPAPRTLFDRICRRNDHAKVFDDLISEMLPSITYRGFDYGSGATLFDATLAGRFVPAILAAAGHALEPRFLPADSAVCRAIVREAGDGSWVPPYAFLMQELAL